MASFADPFPGLQPGSKLSHSETVRAVRLLLAGELEAASLYEAVAESTDDPAARAVLESIAREERVHTGELGALLEHLLPDEGELVDDGEREAARLIGSHGHGSDSADLTEAL